MVETAARHTEQAQSGSGEAAVGDCLMVVTERAARGRPLEKGGLN